MFPTFTKNASRMHISQKYVSSICSISTSFTTTASCPPGQLATYFGEVLLANVIQIGPLARREKWTSTDGARCQYSTSSGIQIPDKLKTLPKMQCFSANLSEWDQPQFLCPSLFHMQLVAAGCMAVLFPKS